ncbi:MAG: hypothetical protein P8Z36_05320 [Gemmatimonadota bacterium]|jgi:hypothetical protein
MRVIAGAKAAAIAAVWVFAGCAANGFGSSSRGEQTTLTRREILSVEGVRDLYDVVQRLRPRWIEADKRAGREDVSGTNRGVLVYQGQAYLGHIDVLRQLRPDMAYELRWLDATTAAATLPFASGYGKVAGAIVIRADPDP